MDLFDTDQDIAELEFQLPHLSGGAHLDALVRLAWKLHQRDSAKAIQYADQAKQAIDDAEQHHSVSNKTAVVSQKKYSARLNLVYAEVQRLKLALPQAENLAHLALQQFTEINDWRGCADTHWLLAWIAVDAGNVAVRDREYAEMAEAARRGGDLVRRDIAEAAAARWLAFSNPSLAYERWHDKFAQLANDPNPARAMWSNEFLSVLFYCTGDIANAMSHSIKTYKKALEIGQIYFAIMTANNIADELNQLNENLMALEWVQRALDLARKSSWARSIASCLLVMSETLRFINNLSAAQDMLNEALTTLAPIPSSRTYTLALYYQGNLALSRQDYDVAFESFRQLEQRAIELKLVDFKIAALRGQATALSFLEKPEEALLAIDASLSLAHEDGESFRQIEILMMMADISRRYPHLFQKTNTERAIALDYLCQALEIAESISGFVIPSRLYEMLSQEHAAVGEFEQAYLMAQKAISAREKIQNNETIARATTMQVFHQMERVREESEVHRELAITEARRAEELLQITTTLEQLGAIGCEITTHLDLNDIFQVLDRYVHSLLDINTFKVYLVDHDHKQLQMIYCVENGEKYEVSYVDLNDPTANSARCFRERLEMICDFSIEEHVTLIEGTLQTLTGLFFPLVIGERMIGVMSVESLRANAFGQREFLIFRSLCAYAAIGLDNAQTYQQLQTTQKQLVYNEKMASLGSLVAGVAHELNTPIGNGLLLASSLNEKSSDIAQKYKDNTMRRSDLVDYLDECQRGSYLIFRSFQTAADLVMSFKQVSVDQTNAQRRVFDLHKLLSDIVATMRNQFINKGVAVELSVPSAISMDSYPGSLGQVVMNLMQNALMHGFEGRSHGTLAISAGPIKKNHVMLRFTDDGVGIPPENLEKIFDPFFTTKLGRGGNGLGLSISYNIIKSVLDGDVTVKSRLGHGTTFSLILPVVVATTVNPS